MTSRLTLLSVIYGIIFITVADLAGIFWLLSVHVEVPDTMENIVVAGLAALTGLLASTRSGLGANEKEPTVMVPQFLQPQEVTVTNAPSDPVPVEATTASASSPRDPR